jgi:hypothetical protein
MLIHIPNPMRVPSVDADENPARRRKNPLTATMNFFGSIVPLPGLNLARADANPSAGSVLAGLLVAGAAVGGGWWLYKHMKTPAGTADKRVVQTYAGFENNPDIWAFVIYAGPPVAGTPPIPLHGPDGPYATQAAAAAAGQNWLAEHPPGEPQANPMPFARSRQRLGYARFG